jgi:hypothetical protein
MANSTVCTLLHVYTPCIVLKALMTIVRVHTAARIYTLHCIEGLDDYSNISSAASSPTACAPCISD